MERKTMKRFFRGLFCAAFALTLILGLGLRAEATEVRSGTLGDNNEISWAYDGAGTLTIDGTGAMPDFSTTNMPWYRHRNTMTTVTIGEGITYIGKNAFNGFSALSTVTIEGNGCELGISAFSKNAALTTLNASNGIGNVGENAFYECSSLASVTFADTAETIGRYAFYKCKALTSVTIPEGIKKVDTYAFQYCEGLTTLVVESEEATLASYSFQYTPKLVDVTIPRTVTFENNIFSASGYADYFGSSNNQVFWKIEDGVLRIYGEGSIGPKTTDEIKLTVTEIIIEEGITSAVSFEGFSGVTKVTIPETVKEIGSAAFRGCTGLKEINLPSGLEKIGYYAFQNTTGLESLTVPENVTEVGTGMIRGSGIKELVLKADIEYNDSYTFDECPTIESLIIEKGSIGYGLFTDAAESLKTVTIGKGVRNIGDGAFSGITALETVTLEEGAYTEIGSEAFFKCTSLKEVVIPKNVVSIGLYAFRGCTSLEKVTFFEGLETIGGKAFADCTSLDEAEIPLSVTKIGDYAFNGVVSAEEGKEESFVAGDYFLIRGYINTEAEKYASKRYFNCTFEPLGGDISLCKMTLNPVMFIYDGTAKEPTVVVKTPLSGTELVCGTMYTEPVYANNVNPGKNASATVEGIGEWYGTLSKTFEISGGDEPEEPEKPSNPTISEEEMMMMYEIMMEMGLIDSETTKFSPEQYEETIAMFAEFGYSRADAEYFMDYFGFWGGASTDEGFGEEPVYRVSGTSRYETSYKTADVLKEQLGVDKFDTAIIAYGKNFPDALAGSYLAGKTDAPILMINDKYAGELTDYVKANVRRGGTVYVLGGEGAIPDSQLNGLGDYDVTRLAGKTRYETNLQILEEAGVTNQDILVCTGKSFADSLSASATGKPILLLNNKEITEEQRVFLEQHAGNQYYIIGGTGAISAEMEEMISQYGPTERIAGKTRYETSVKLAEKFFSNADVAVIASAKNFPDGLCGGPLAMSKNAPLILTADGKEDVAVEFMNKNNIGVGAVLGGTGAVGDDTVESVFGVPDITIW